MRTAHLIYLALSVFGFWVSGIVSLTNFFNGEFTTAWASLCCCILFLREIKTCFFEAIALDFINHQPNKKMRINEEDA